ncbi:MAG TPA: FAD-dependent oxidoreductase [Xanthomonadales bacterium]|nr:FAD-dependent oxidoreductase [Xanthomonadales bacterium]
MKSFNMFLSHLGMDGSMTSMKKASFEVALKEKKQIAERTMTFVFEKPKDFQFKAGQHVRLTLLNPHETDSKGNSRFMTLANTPQDKDLVVAMRMTNSAFKRVLSNLKIGEKVLIQILLGVPHGAFALHDDPSRPAVFLTGGIGMVPAYSMIKDATERKLPHELFLFYSNRRPEDSPYLGELQTLEKQNPNFKLIATMTQIEKSKQSWQGETGFINQSMLNKHIDDLNFPIYYIAGLTDMVNSMKTLLKDLKVSEVNIKAEDFSGSKMSIMNMNQNSKKSKNYLVIAAIGLMILFGILTHAGAIISIFRNGFNATSFNNPLFYLMIGVMLVAFKVKFKYLLKYKHATKK